MWAIMWSPEFNLINRKVTIHTCQGKNHNCLSGSTKLLCNQAFTSGWIYLRNQVSTNGWSFILWWHVVMWQWNFYQKSHASTNGWELLPQGTLGAK